MRGGGGLERSSGHPARRSCPKLYTTSPAVSHRVKCRARAHIPVAANLGTWCPLTGRSKIDTVNQIFQNVFDRRDLSGKHGLHSAGESAPSLRLGRSSTVRPTPRRQQVTWTPRSCPHRRNRECLGTPNRNAAPPRSPVQPRFTDLSKMRHLCSHIQHPGATPVAPAARMTRRRSVQVQAAQGTRVWVSRNPFILRKPTSRLRGG